MFHIITAYWQSTRILAGTLWEKYNPNSLTSMRGAKSMLSSCKNITLFWTSFYGQASYAETAENVYRLSFFNDWIVFEIKNKDFRKNWKKNSENNYILLKRIRTLRKSVGLERVLIWHIILAMFPFYIGNSMPRFLG